MLYQRVTSIQHMRIPGVETEQQPQRDERGEACLVPKYERNGSYACDSEKKALKPGVSRLSVKRKLSKQRRLFS
jgi:hypothetical protein